MMDTKIIGLAHGPMVGVQYFAKGEGDMGDGNVEDWNELSIYLLLICISIRWW